VRLSSRLSLTQQNALLLLAFFILFELLVASAITYFLMLPMARRSTADLAGLRTLSAQTWSELPPVPVLLSRSNWHARMRWRCAPSRRTIPCRPRGGNPICAF
jgi:hypothetical protein